MSRAAAVLLALLTLLLVALPAAHAGETTPPRGPADPNAISSPATLDGNVEAHKLNGLKARAIATRDERTRAARREFPRAQPEVYLKGQARWQVSWFTPGTGDRRREIAQVIIDDASGTVTEVWTGPQVAWTMARGYDGAFARKMNSPWIWVPLTVLFVLPFMVVRRPGWLQLDIVVLAAFGFSVMFFNDANLNASVPIAFALMAYLFVRAVMLAFGRRGRDAERPPGPLPLLVPVTWLAVALVFLVGFRIGLNIKASNVIDVGYSGVIGADRLMDGKPLYGHFPKDNSSGDTYGPVAYLSYIPFEQALPWSGKWDDLWPAHAAAITFDLLTILTLLGLGWRIRGPALGIVMAYAWAAWPFSLYAMNCNSNDSLVAWLVALTLLVAGRPAARGAVAMIGGLTKFVSLALLPLLATHDWEGRRAAVLARYTCGAVVAFALAWLPILLRGESPQRIFDRTLGFQFGRDAPFSIWGLYDWSLLQHGWQLIAIVFALVAPLLPRRRDIAGLAALAAAILIAMQLAATYWFYLYLVWFFPPLILALLGAYGRPARVPLRPSPAHGTSS